MTENSRKMVNGGYTTTRRDFLQATGVGLGFLGFGGLLEGCTGAKTTTGPDSPPPATAPKNAVLRIAIGSQPQTLDAHKLVAGTDNYFHLNVYESLLGYGPDGKQIPKLAAAMPTMSKDGKTFTVDLRSDAFFHDGAPVTAEDVKFSFERYVDPKTGNGFAYNLKGLDGVEVLSPTRVAIHLKEYDAGFITQSGYARIVPKKYIQEHGDDYFGQHPIGTGPWGFESREINKNFILKRFDKYYGEKPGYTQAIFSIIPDNATRIAALQSGQVDLIAQVPPQNIKTLSSSAGIKVKSTLDGDSVNIRINMRLDGPWKEQRVREAMEYAIDREAILRSVVGGFGELDTLIQPTNKSFDRAKQAGLLTQRPYNPEQAKQLLKDAGYASGFSFKFAGVTNGRLPQSAEITQAVAGYWTAIGLKPEIEILNYDAWIAAIKKTSNYPVVFNLWGDQLGGPLPRFRGDFTPDAIYSFVEDQQLDKLIVDAAATVDQDKMDDAFVKVARYVQDHVYAIPLFALQGSFGMRDTVNWAPWYGVPVTIMQNARPT